jgi:UDP-glucose 4-epimerase
VSRSESKPLPGRLLESGFSNAPCFGTPRVVPSLTNKSVLVTGGAGFIGSHLVDRLIAERPRSIVVVDNLFLGRPDNLKMARSNRRDLEEHRLDASELEPLRSVMAAANVDVVFNLAVLPLPLSLERPAWTVQQNVGTTLACCELLRAGAYETLIHFSSSEAYGTAVTTPMDESHPLEPTTPYAASKAASDHLVMSYVRTFGVDAAIVRPFNNFGPRQNEGSYAAVIPIVIGHLLRGEAIEIHGDGKQTRDFLFVTDTADAAVRIYQEPGSRGSAINVASGVEVSINALVSTIAEIMATEPIIRRVPARIGDVRRHVGGIARARQLIDFEPRVELRDGLDASVRWYKHGLWVAP